jgi:hypothetical protein
LNVRAFEGYALLLEGIDGTFDGLDLLHTSIESVQVSQVGEGGEFVAAGPVQVQARRQPGGLTNFAVERIDLDGANLRWQWARAWPLLRRLFSAVANGSSETSGDGENEPADGDEAPRSSNDGAEGSPPPSFSIRSVLPRTLSFRDAGLTLVWPPNAEGEAGVELALQGLAGSVFLGDDEEPPQVNVEGRAGSNGGSFHVVAGLRDGLPSAQVELQRFPLGRFAQEFSFPALRVAPEALAEADMTITRQPDGPLAFRGRAGLSALTVEHRLLANGPIEGVEAHFNGSGAVDLGARILRLDEGTAQVNGVHLGLGGLLRRSDDTWAVELSVSLRPLACEALRRALPLPFRDRLDALRVEGTIGGQLRLVADSARPDGVQLELDLDNSCRAQGEGFLSAERLQGAFVHRVELPDEEAFEFRTGPGSGSWAPLPNISRHMIDAVLTTEDGRFFFHRGFSLSEIRRALSRDLAAGRPAFGASTITMQLARNLFLSRERNLARKFQEAVLTWYLEESFSKDELMALYLNIIEYGPQLFGIRQAAMYYFGRQPGDLSPREAVFLAKLLPSPVRRHGQTYEEGELSARWRGVLDRVLRVMFDRGRLTPGELERALAQRIEFYRPGDPLPALRQWRRNALSGVSATEAAPARWLDVDTPALLPPPRELMDF